MYSVLYLSICIPLYWNLLFQTGLFLLCKEVDFYVNESKLIPPSSMKIQIINLTLII